MPEQEARCTGASCSGNTREATYTPHEVGAGRAGGLVLRRVHLHLMLATLEDTANPLAWSGTALAVRGALAGAVEQLTVVDNLRVKKHPAHAALRIALGGKPARYPLWMSKPALQQFARETAAAIEQHRPQALFCISSQCLIYLHAFYKGPPIPTFLFSDSAWMAWLEVYKGYYPVPIGAKRFAARERDAARRATGLIYASEWAKQDAVQRFDVAPEKIHVQPLGASWVPSEDDAAIERAVHARSSTTLELVFLAKEWERKGGPLALSIARELQQRLPTSNTSFKKVRLNIIGVRPEIAPADQPLVRLYGMLRRSDPAESAQLRQLLLTSHFLVVPTLAECYGLVFAEAQAFALPPISRAVDAVPSILLDNQTGILQPKDAGPSPYVDCIFSLLQNDRSLYTQMALAGRKHYTTRLNWPAFGRGIAQIIESALHH
jgi:glycosyltransferase involved in cell wall biosynthesis